MRTSTRSCNVGWIAVGALLTVTPRGSWAAVVQDRAGTPRESARGSARDSAPGAPKRLRAERVTGSRVRVDGDLGDATWQRAAWASDFAQREPVEGATPAARTEIAVAYDDDALYVAARLHGDGTSSPRALVTRRDREGSSEQLVVSLDTYRDRRTAYSFGVTAAGVRLDYYHAADAQGQRDYSFDPVWEAATRVTGTGWTAELRIPLSQLRFNRAPAQRWGLNVSRVIPARNEEDYWVLVRRTETGWASRFGELVGLDGVEPRRRVELVPYVASDARRLGNPDPGNPFLRRQAASARAGADVKVGLGSSLTLDATVNPDFGQVEADPAEVNLSAFETIFPERRPFFVDGAQFLRGGGLPFFLSRRIGQAPRLRPAADYAEPVTSTTILGAAKLTGQLPSGLSVGVLGAATARERARTFTASTGRFGDEVVEPATGYGVVRLQQQFGRDASTAGLILTAVERAVEAGTPPAALLPRRAHTGALDWNLRFRGGAYSFSGAAGFSAVSGDSLAMLRVQQSSTHFFERPDAVPVRLDSSRTTLLGRWLSARFDKNAGRWLWGVNAYDESPGLELNDAGRLGGADDMGVGGVVRFRQTQPGRRLRNWEVGAETYSEWTHDDVHQGLGVLLFTNVTSPRFWTGGLVLSAGVRALSDNLTRGGPLMGIPATASATLTAASNPARKARWTATATFSGDELGARAVSLGAGLVVRPGTRWELSADPRYNRGTGSRQFVAALGGGPAATFDRRYVFSFIERSELSARLRLNFALTPDVAVETYAEPFAASGRYFRFGELPRPRSLALREYGTDGTTFTRLGRDSVVVTDGGARFALPNPDFNVLSFRSNAVLRWEWRPGSTAFLVWQQNRAARDATGALVRPSGLWDALSATGDNYLAVKVAYWIPVP